VKIRDALLRWWRTDNLLREPLRCEVVILFDADMQWTAHEEKRDLTPEQTQMLVAGLFEMAQAIADKYGVIMRRTTR
jgi:hypothetical protein